MSTKILHRLNTSGNTTGIATVKLTEYTVPASTIILFRTRLVGLHIQASSEGDAGVGGYAIATARRGASGGPSFVNGDAVNSIAVDKDTLLSGTVITYAISGNNVQLNVTGIAVYSIDWFAETRVFLWTP